MEGRYGIGINNRYALFLEGEDGEDLMLAKKKPVDATKTPVETSKAPVKKVDSSDNKKEKPANNQNNRNANATKDSKPNNREGKILLRTFEAFFTRKSTITLN